MTKISIVILTDHSQHSVHNSFYSIASSLFHHYGVKEVIVVSRKDKRNATFFSNGFSDYLYGTKLSEPITFRNRDIMDRGEFIDLYEDVFFLLRLPHPVSSTFLLNLEKHYGADRIINRPSGILKTGSKAFLTSLSPEYTPEIQLCERAEDIHSFISHHPKAVLKPLMNYGGKGILKIENELVISASESMSLSAFISNYENNPQLYLAVEYLENVKNGDKRIVVANGEILTAALRYPAEGGWLCNIAQGGHDEVSEPTPREREIVTYLSPLLMKEGILIYGLDTLEDNDGRRIISEINTLSPGGITPYEKHTGKNITAKIAEVIVEYCHQLK